MDLSQNNTIFISYSHADKAWLDRLNTFLKPLIRESDFVVWDDTQIAPGRVWKEEIHRLLNSSRVAILLVSQNFLASEFIYGEELPVIFEAADAGHMQIVWIHIGHSTYDLTRLKDFQAANDPQKPLNSLPDYLVEKELVSICQKVKAAFYSTALSSKSKDKPARGRRNHIPEIAPDDW